MPPMRPSRPEREWRKRREFLEGFACLSPLLVYVRQRESTSQGSAFKNRSLKSPTGFPPWTERNRPPGAFKFLIGRIIEIHLRRHNSPPAADFRKGHVIV